MHGKKQQSTTTAAEELQRRQKLVVVGDGGCGKTCLLVTFSRDEFPEEHIPTIFETHVAEIQLEERTVELVLWDTAGQETYDKLRPISYPHTNVILVCFAVDSQDSFYNVVNTWVPEVRHFCPSTPIILVGTKTDMRSSELYGDRSKGKLERRFITTEEGREMAKCILAFKYVECSAKTKTGVSEVFMTAARASLLAQTTPRHRHCVVL